MSALLPWIVAAALLAYVVWMNARKGPASIALPPLAPLPGVATLPPLSPSAPAGGGMNPLLLGAILIPWGLMAWSHFTPPAPGPDPAPAPAPDNGPTLDLRGAFVGETAAEDALVTHYLSDSLARWVAYDGTLKEPRLKTGAAFADLRKSARDGRMEGLTLGARQPLAKERIKAYLDAAVGDFGGPADEVFRAKFVRAMHVVSEKAAEAVGRKP